MCAAARFALAIIPLTACSSSRAGDSSRSAEPLPATAGGQVADGNFVIELPTPRFAAGTGPMVCVDAAHENFHTIETRYAPFATVLRAEGYTLQSLASAATAATLAPCAVLVIANALPPAGAAGDRRGSPFSPAEVDAIHLWVRGGGGLFLIADHQPFPLAAAPLAASFGFALHNGFALKSGHTPPDVFRREDGTLASHPLLNGQVDGQAIESVAAFTGSAFQLADGAQSILTFPEGYFLLFPVRPWEFDSQTPRLPIAGWSQGATLDVEKGRLVIFAEAAMFTSQTVDGGEALGLLHPAAQGNVGLLRRLLGWLSGA